MAGVQAKGQDPIGLTSTKEDAGGMSKKPSYSPYAGRGFPTQVYWGDSHVHTDNSLDARGFGVTSGLKSLFVLPAVKKLPQATASSSNFHVHLTG